MPNYSYWHDSVAFTASCRKYERTNPRGYLMRSYRNMLSRVVGIQKKKAHLYLGLTILPKSHFYAWAMADDSAFWPLWHAYQASGRDQRLAPSVDRIDSTEGYTLGNMQWLTHSQNSAKGATSSRRKRKVVHAVC